MASMFVRHRVANYSAWKAIFDQEEAARRQHGVAGHSLPRDPQEPKLLLVALRFNDVIKAQEFAASDNFRQAMIRAGVHRVPEVWFGDDIEEKTYR